MCDKRMGFSEKALFNKVDGTPRKKKTLVYQVDHVETNAPFLDLERDIAAYVSTLMFGELRVLCYECHVDVTKKQKKKG